MNLAAMRTKFGTSANDLDASLSDSEIDGYLNRAYQFAIPADVGGTMSEVLWSLETTAGTTAYSVPESIVAPANDSAAWINSYIDGSSVTQPIGEYFLRVLTDYAWFQSRYAYTGTDQALPSAALIYGRTLTLNRPPDRDYIVQIPSRGGPIAALTSDGIPNDVHATAVVYSGLMEYLDETEDEAGRAKAEREYTRWRRRLNAYAQGTPNERMRARSF